MRWNTATASFGRARAACSIGKISCWLCSISVGGGVPVSGAWARHRRGPASSPVLSACTASAVRRAKRRDRGRGVHGPAGEGWAIPTTSSRRTAASTGARNPRSSAAGTAGCRAQPMQPAPGGQRACACAVAPPQRARSGRNTALRSDFLPGVPKVGVRTGELRRRRGQHGGPPSPSLHAERGPYGAYDPSGALDPALRARARARRRQGRESGGGTALTARRGRPPRAAFCRAAGPAPRRSAARGRGPRGACSVRAAESRRGWNGGVGRAAGPVFEGEGAGLLLAAAGPPNRPPCTRFVTNTSALEPLSRVDTIPQCPVAVAGTTASCALLLPRKQGLRGGSKPPSDLGASRLSLPCGARYWGTWRARSARQGRTRRAGRGTVTMACDQRRG